MTQRSGPQTGNFALFMLLAFAVLMVNTFLFRQPEKAEKEKPAAQKALKDGEQKDKKGDAKEPDKEKAPVAKSDEKSEKPADESKAVADKKKPADKKSIDKEAIKGDFPRTKPEERRITLGSADPDSPYRMLVTLTDRGAAVERIELNSPRYVALTDPSGFLSETAGYLGHLALDVTTVRVVGTGTPADKAGLKPGDRIDAINGVTTATKNAITEILSASKPGRNIELTINRGGVTKKITATLGRFPLEVVRPETMKKLEDSDVLPTQDPLSYLLTMAQIDTEVLPETIADPDAPKDVRPAYVNKEIPGLNLRDGTWEIGKHDDTSAEFICKLPRWDIEVVKTYRLKQVAQKEQDNVDAPAYSLVFTISIRNTGQESRKVAYQLDGPTGLPIEGWWYANKVGRVWSAGLRDMVISFGDEKGEMGMVGCPAIADDDPNPASWHDKPVASIGIDAQYFASVLMPKKESPDEIWFDRTQPLRVGPVDPDIKKITDTSFRLRSLVKEIEPGASLSHEFEIFAGPKRPPLLENYGLGELVYYGWFTFCAKPMVAIVHFFYGIVRNYGLAIIMLTVLVRGLMFPLSRKQALGAQKMAELQPEIKKLQEKYKKDLEARGRAQRELFQKHNYNPMSGCLVMFVQLPIFIGLYRGLMVDVELRGSSLFGGWLSWCSNLAAPDMLFDWMSFMPGFITDGVGMFGLGPYFNLLPILTIFLFIAQQKMFMPPPADEQQAMQQKMMKYMMVFMGILFFKVASGLCVYFIASSGWGLCERKLLPKPPHKKAGDTGTEKAAPTKGGPPAKREKIRPTGKKKGRGRK
ncbi:MAG: YidC/Oxa1 family insertase periplasmic-domain containing protein [Pirellulales bacterium]|nr:YidC/Oxa1 family insertase periplasmic-domain containing protein [Pirellulales bacterium]